MTVYVPAHAGLAGASSGGGRGGGEPPRRAVGRSGARAPPEWTAVRRRRGDGATGDGDDGRWPGSAGSAGDGPGTSATGRRGRRRIAGRRRRAGPGRSGSSARRRGDGADAQEPGSSRRSRPGGGRPRWLDPVVDGVPVAARSKSSKDTSERTRRVDDVGGCGSLDDASAAGCARSPGAVTPDPGGLARGDPVRLVPELGLVVEVSVMVRASAARPGRTKRQGLTPPSWNRNIEVTGPS